MYRMLFVGVGLLLINSTASAASIIGAGNIGSSVLNDLGPNLIAVDLTNPANLGAGTYSVSTFDYQFVAGQTPIGGTVQPFLAVGSAPNFTVIALGSTVAFSGQTAFISTAFGGSNSFTLASTQSVFAAVYWNTTPGQVGTQRMPVGYIPSGSTFLRFSSANAPTLGNPISGGAGVGSFSRTYDFSITVNPASAVPEPSSFVLLGLATVAVAGLMGWQRTGR